MRATKKLLQENTRLNNHLVAARSEMAALRGLCDDAYGLIIDHHAHGRMVGAVCEPCSQMAGRQIMNRLERIRKQQNFERLQHSKLGHGNLPTLEMMNENTKRVG